jgi:caa(3)-type oxidase subunit IV
MADKGKKAKSGGATGTAKKTGASSKAPASAEKSEKVSAADDDHAHDEHGHDEPGHDEHAHDEHAHDPHAAHDAGGHGAGAKAHEHAPNYREYFMVFVVLFVLTVLEVAVTKVPGINRKLMGLALVSMALTKAAFVGLYYMHLKHETKVLKLTVAIPLAAPTIYALVLISEAAWRLTR